MDSYSERAQQRAIRQRLESRRSGFVPFDLAGDETLPRMFHAQASIRASRRVVVGDKSFLTYAELDRIAGNIGFIAGRRFGEQREPIAVLVSKRTSFVASILGVLRAGGFYVPIDPSFPEDRNSLILQESKARYVLTERVHQELAQRLARQGQELIYVDEVEECETQFLDQSKPDDLACLIFTSGSTGRPKGVMQTHRNLLQVARRYTNGLHLGFRGRVSLLSSCSVTASIGTTFGSLLNGATVCGFSVLEGGLAGLVDWLDAERITVYRSVPSLFRHLVESVSEDRIFHAAQIVRLGGGSLYQSDWKLFTQHFAPDAILVNFYGCSEMSTAACFYMDSTSQIPEGVVPVGGSLDDVEISVMDENEQISCFSEDGEAVCAPGIVGEIVLTSPYLSPGYWNDIPTTDAKFTALGRATSGVRSYRTGDLGCLREGEGLVHVGRGDSQVKVSGFRVELAEVEACLRSCPGVKAAAVIFHSPERRERELIGFVEMEVGNSRKGLDTRSYIQARLPLHMAPSTIIVVDRIPQTPNGKADRSALIKLREDSWSIKERRNSRTPTEEALSEIWRQVLNLQHVGMDDDFFELGGNSLLGMTLVSRIADRFGVSLRFITVLQNATVAQMVNLVEDSSHRTMELAPDHEGFEDGTV